MREKCIRIYLAECIRDRYKKHREQHYCQQQYDRQQHQRIEKRIQFLHPPLRREHDLILRDRLHKRFVIAHAEIGFEQMQQRKIQTAGFFSAVLPAVSSET